MTGKIRAWFFGVLCCCVLVQDASGKQWPLKAVGRVTCDGDPLVGLTVKLADQDFGLVADDIMGAGITDENGNFEISGSGEDAFGGQPDPYILVEYKYEGKYGKFSVDNHWGRTRKERTIAKKYPQSGATVDFNEIKLGGILSYCPFYKKFYNTREAMYKNGEYVKEFLRVRTGVNKPLDYTLAQCSIPGLVILPKDCTPVALTPQKTKEEIQKASAEKDCSEEVVKKEEFSNCTSRYSPKYGGICKDVQICRGGTLRGLCPGKNNIMCCLAEASPLPEPASPLIDKETFLKLFSDTTRNRALFPYFDKALKYAGITKCHAQGAFVAQISYESSGLLALEESARGKNYEGDLSLGNTQSGDGKKYLGRGILRVIGRAAYQKVQNGIGHPIIERPELLALPSVAFSSTAWLWSKGLKITRGNQFVDGNLNELCDGTNYGFYLLTYAINKKLTGLQERIKLWKKAVDILGCGSPTPGHGPNCTSGTSSGQCTLATDCKGSKPVDNNNCPKLQTKSSQVRCCVKDTSNSNACSSRYSPFYDGTCVDVRNCEGGTLSGLCSGKRTKCCLPEINPIPEPTNPVMKKDLYLKLVYNTARNRALFRFFDKAMKEANITTCHRQAAFMAQMAHETASFTSLEEYSDGKKYEFRKKLGNTQPGDGPKFIGRGLIHLTGRYNYDNVKKGTGLPIVDHPEMVVIPSVAFDTTVWMWKNGFRIVHQRTIESESLNYLCDGTTYSYYLMTYAINGGFNGLEDRLNKWNRAINILGCTPKKRGRGPSCTDPSTGESGYCDIADLCTGRSIIVDKTICPKTVHSFLQCCIT